ncbi:MAG: ATP-binding protein [Woeseiaceae bacterium]|nr:ATP-binding protein [Woeseiaceae bacterium]
MKKSFNRSIESLSDVYEFTEGVLAANDIGDAVKFPVHLAMEELFVNMVEYHPESSEDIVLEVEAEDGKVSVTMRDFDVEPFDVTAPSTPDTDAALEERTPGGLGLYLIQTMVDNLEYNYEDRRSTVRFTKE